MYRGWKPDPAVKRDWQRSIAAFGRDLELERERARRAASDRTPLRVVEPGATHGADRTGFFSR